MNKLPLTPRDDAALNGELAALRQAMEQESPAPSLEARILATVKQRQGRRLGWQQLARWLTPALALATGIAVISWIASPPQVPDGLGDAYSTAAGESRPFIALQSLERIEAESSLQIVNTTMPRFALSGYGIDVAPENAGESVRAQWLVSYSGDLLAVRISSL